MYRFAENGHRTNQSMSVLCLAMPVFTVCFELHPYEHSAFSVRFFVCFEALFPQLNGAVVGGADGLLEFGGEGAGVEGFDALDGGAAG